MTYMYMFTFLSCKIVSGKVLGKKWAPIAQKEWIQKKKKNCDVFKQPNTAFYKNFFFNCSLFLIMKHQFPAGAWC